MVISEAITLMMAPKPKLNDKINSLKPVNKQKKSYRKETSKINQQEDEINAKTKKRSSTIDSASSADSASSKKRSSSVDSD